MFVHLHNHSEYSFLDGVSRIDILVDTACKLQFDALALTDHGNLCGAFEFYQTCKKNGLKPILGCEVYVEGEKGDNFHLTILAKNREGWRNLCILSSRSWKDNFYYKPRVKKEWLKNYSEGLIVLSGCLASELASYVLNEQFDKADLLIEFYRTTFKDDFYLELQPHKIEAQQTFNEFLKDRAKLLGIPLVLTNDSHYPDKHYQLAQEVLMCISTRKTLDDPTRLRHENLELHLKSAEEMMATCQTDEELEAFKNTSLISSKVSLNFQQMNPIMPKFSTEKSSEDILKELSEQGFRKKILEKVSTEDISKYRKRLEFELQQITKLGFRDYFLVVADFINWAKANGIPVGPGRGSVAGSLVAYLLGITELDPLEYNLFFERFLNPDRVSLPDIDVDFCQEKRDLVIDYVKSKYGEDKVAGIATFGTLKARAAIKDVGRVLGYSFAELERIAQLIPAPRQGFDYSLRESMELEPKLKQAQEKHQQLFDVALKLEGLVRHSSKHAAGVVICGEPIEEIVPVMVDKDGQVITQFSMYHLEFFGVIKFDFLGLETLTFLEAVKNLIKARRGLSLELEKIKLDDPATYSLLASGDTLGVFQLESSGIRDMLKRLKPSCFEDLIALLALYRPGPLESKMAERYILRKNKKEDVVYLHEEMKEILESTYGIIIYQEQIMQLAQKLAGYTLAEADILRKAMGKKNPEEMAKQRKIFIEGCKKNSIDEKIANAIFDQMETFAKYGFNKSHSAAYALLSYRSAYLKAHFPLEFIATYLTFKSSDTEKVYEILADCKAKGIKVEPPNINKSSRTFVVRENSIIFSLEAIKGISQEVAIAIEKERSKGLFSSLDNFISRMPEKYVNKKTLEALIKAGCFNDLHPSAVELLKHLPEYLKKKSVKKSLFESKTDEPDTLLSRIKMEKEALGFFLSAHPFDYFKLDFSENLLKLSDLNEINGLIKCLVIIQNVKFKSTRRGERYATFFVEDKTKTLEAICWPSVLKKIEDVLVDGECGLLIANSEKIDEKIVLNVKDFIPVNSLIENNSKLVVVELPANTSPEEIKAKMVELLKHHSGDTLLRVEFVSNGFRKEFSHPSFRVKPSEALCMTVEKLFKSPALRFHISL